MQGNQFFKEHIKKLAVKPFVKTAKILFIMICFVSAIMKKDRYLQSWTKYFEQNGVIQYNWAGEEKFGICFCVFFDCYLQSLSS